MGAMHLDSLQGGQAWLALGRGWHGGAWGWLRCDSKEANRCECSRAHGACTMTPLHSLHFPHTLGFLLIHNFQSHTRCRHLHHGGITRGAATCQHNRYTTLSPPTQHNQLAYTTPYTAPESPQHCPQHCRLGLSLVYRDHRNISCTLIIAIYFLAALKPFSSAITAAR